MSDIKELRGEYRYLSNFWVLNKGITTVDGLVVPTVEHAYQAEKFRHPIRQLFYESGLTAGQAKRLGKSHEGSEHNNWPSRKISCMNELVRQKFLKNPDLAKRLVSTGDRRIIEGNRWGDTFWGVDLGTGEGSNLLGIVLMQVRESIKETS